MPGQWGKDRRHHRVQESTQNKGVCMFFKGHKTYEFVETIKNIDRRHNRVKKSTQNKVVCMFFKGAQDLWVCRNNKKHRIFQSNEMQSVCN